MMLPSRAAARVVQDPHGLAVDQHRAGAALAQAAAIFGAVQRQLAAKHIKQRLILGRFYGPWFSVDGQG